MNDSIRIRGQVRGYDEAVRSLRNVGNERQRQNIMRAAVASMGRVVRDKARQPEYVPVGKRARVVPGYGVLPPGSLRKSLRVTTRIERGGNLSRLAGAYGVRGQVIAGDRRKGIYWAHFVERGTQPHVITRRAADGTVSRYQHPGARAVRYMERAGRDTQREREQVFASYVTQRLARLQKTGSA